MDGEMSYKEIARVKDCVRLDIIRDAFVQSMKFPVYEKGVDGVSIDEERMLHVLASVFRDEFETWKRNNLPVAEKTEE